MQSVSAIFGLVSPLAPQPLSNNARPAPDAAIQGFLKSAGLSSLEEATIQKDPKKGDFYVALIDKPGRPAIEVLGEILPLAVRTLPWPKSMRWGTGRLTWVRPLHSILCTLGGRGRLCRSLRAAAERQGRKDQTQN